MGNSGVCRRSFVNTTSAQVLCKVSNHFGNLTPWYFLSNVLITAISAFSLTLYSFPGFVLFSLSLTKSSLASGITVLPIRVQLIQPESVLSKHVHKSHSVYVCYLVSKCFNNYRYEYVYMHSSPYN